MPLVSATCSLRSDVDHQTAAFGINSRRSHAKGVQYRAEYMSHEPVPSWGDDVAMLPWDHANSITLASTYVHYNKCKGSGKD
jgi:hypothetical protein